MHGGKRGAALPLPVVRHIARQLLEALEFLHDECGIIHTGGVLVRRLGCCACWQYCVPPPPLSLRGAGVCPTSAWLSSNLLPCLPACLHASSMGSFHLPADVKPENVMLADPLLRPGEDGTQVCGGSGRGRWCDLAACHAAARRGGQAAGRCCARASGALQQADQLPLLSLPHPARLPSLFRPPSGGPGGAGGAPAGRRPAAGRLWQRLLARQQVCV